MSVAMIKPAKIPRPPNVGITILWTAYKFTEKVGISGTFEDYAVYNDNVSNSIEGVLEKLKLSIPTECVDSGNAIRDFKLRTYFFQAFNTEIINGTIINAKGGEGIINLRMNNFSIDNPYTYVLRNDTIVILTHLDLKKWKGEEALTTLNKECYELHKGKNGISKLWPDVNVEIKLPVKKHQ